MSDRLKKIFDNDEHDLLKVTPRSKSVNPEDRLAVSFLEINDFYAENGRLPAVDTIDINERKLGVRLRSILLDDSKVEALSSVDTHGLLKPAAPPESLGEIFEADKFGLLDDPSGILTIRNVPKSIRKADSISRAQKSQDFAKYESGFIEVQSGLKAGQWIRAAISSEDQIQPDLYFVFNGILAFVENRESSFDANGKNNARLHVIFENGTESNILLRSFARTLYRAKEGARVLPISERSDDLNNDDKTSGYIYVLSSLSEDTRIQDLSNLYKIGFTTGTVEDRIKSATNDPTYLMSPVKIEATYKCFNMNTHKLEHLLHRFFSDVKLDLSITGPDGLSATPSEWYVAPLEIIDQAIVLIVNGEIVYYRYDPGIRDIVQIN